jgi:hypothetical protein
MPLLPAAQATLTAAVAAPSQAGAAAAAAWMFMRLQQADTVWIALVLLV